jgi:hypothetical protein
MPAVESSNQIAALVFVVLGVVAGVGFLLVRPAPGEPERVARVFPLARLYRYAVVRVVVALLCFALALFGAASAMGWV